MKKLLLITSLLISNLSFCQLKSIVIDEETKEIIPYVNIWVENENLGTTANENGEFELKINHTKVIHFSAIGYETKKISSDSIKQRVELTPTINELNEVIITAEKSLKELKIGEFKKSKINYYFSCGTTPWIVARFFDYNDNYAKTKYLKRIKVLTNSDVRDAKFNVRLYNINENGAPGDYLYDKNIIGIAKKGKKITEIDISELSIAFPENGFFVAIEWLIIEHNKHEYNYTKENSKKKFKGISYSPKIGAVQADTNENGWVLIQGKWIKAWKMRGFKGKNEKYNNKYSLIAIVLTLSN